MVSRLALAGAAVRIAGDDGVSGALGFAGPPDPLLRCPPGDDDDVPDELPDVASRVPSMLPVQPVRATVAARTRFEVALRCFMTPSGAGLARLWFASPSTRDEGSGRWVSSAATEDRLAKIESVHASRFPLAVELGTGIRAMTARRRTRATAALLLCGVLIGASCGSGRRPHAATPDASGIDSAGFAPGRLRRLTANELAHTLSDVFLDGADFDAELPTDPSMRRFDDELDRLSVAPLLTEALQRAAERVAPLAVQGLAAQLRCDADRDGERACLDSFFDVVVTRAWRRPASTSERQRLLTVYDAAGKLTDRDGAWSATIQAVIQSPNFLFRSELGATDARAGAIVRLTPYEVASALAYFVWAGPPDRALLDAASSGRFNGEQAFVEQTERLLQDARAKRSLRWFFLQWLDLGAPEGLVKGAEVAPNATVDLAARMIAETTRFVEHVLWSGDGRFDTLLLSPLTFVDSELAPLYGVPPPSSDERDWVPVNVDDGTRAGLLTRPAFIAAHTPSWGFSPVRLGRFVRSKLLCGAIAPPPDNVPALATTTSSDASPRARFAAHEAPACRGCHSLIDPIGFGFERYDPLGRLVADGGATGEGTLVGSDVDGPFAGPLELAHKLAASRQVAECFSAQLLSFALGRDVTLPSSRLPVDQQAVDAVADAFVRADGEIKALVLAIVKTDAFLLRSVAPRG